MDVNEFYDHLEVIGMEYGPLFRNVVELSAIPSQHAAYGAVLIPDTQASMPANFEFSHIMHPATMDAIFHLLLAAFTDGQPIEQAAVPYSIEEMFVAAEQPQGVGGRFCGYGQLATKAEGGREIIGELIVSDETWSEPKLTVKGFALRQVTSTDNAGSAARAAKALKKCARVEWSQDVDFIQSSDDLNRLLVTKDNQMTQCQAQLSLWLDKFTHKRAVGQALLVLDEDSSDSSDILRDLCARATQRPGFAQINATATYASGLDTLRSVMPPQSLSESSIELWDTTDDTSSSSGEGAYDVVVVIGDRTTGSKADSLAKLQKVLSPEGHLVVLQSEGSQNNVQTTLETLGLTQKLTITGNGASGMFVAAASNSSPAAPETPSEVYLLLPTAASPKVLALSSSITTLLSSDSVNVHTASLSDTNTSQLVGKHVISLLEVESPFIYAWSESEFASFKSLISSVSHLLWLSRGSLLQSWAASFEFAPAQGLLRVLRNEYTLTTLPHLDLSAGFDATSTRSAELVLSVWQASLIEDAEMEFAELDGAIYIPRAVEDVGFDGELQLASGSAKPVQSPLHAKGVALKLASTVEDGVFLWTDDEDATRPLDPGQVEVEVEYVGLNASDVANTGEDAAVQSREAVGIVSRCGDQVKSVVPGQRVAVFQHQACRTHIRQDESLVAAVPAEMSPQTATALPNVFIAAQYALLEVAGLARSQTVLIHSAASALGQAAVQIAQFVGAKVFALVSSKEEKAKLSEGYGIPSDRIFDSALRNFVTVIAKATAGRGVDAVLAIHDSPAVLPSLTTLGDSGYFLDISSGDIDFSLLNLPHNKRNASLIRVDMDHVVQTKPEVIKTLFQRTFGFFCRSGITKPISPTTIFSVADMKLALDAVKTQRTGKVILSLSRDASVLTLPPPAPELVLDKHGVYVLAGGLGALGLDIANMMVEHGAGHLVFLSRSGGGKNEKDLENFRSRGVRADAFKCDVSDSKSVASVFDQLKREGLVVKGVIQCAMVLEVRVLFFSTRFSYTPSNESLD